MGNAVSFLVMSDPDDPVDAGIETAGFCATLIRMLSRSLFDTDYVGLVACGSWKQTKSPEWGSLESFCLSYSIPLHSEVYGDVSFVDNLDLAVESKAQTLVLIGAGFEKRLEHKTFGIVLDFLSRAILGRGEHSVFLSADRRLGIVWKFMVARSSDCFVCGSEGFTCRPAKRPSFFFKPRLQMSFGYHLDRDASRDAFRAVLTSAAQNTGGDRLVSTRLGLVEVLRKDPRKYCLEDFLWMLNLEGSCKHYDFNILR